MSSGIVNLVGEPINGSSSLGDGDTTSPRTHVDVRREAAEVLSKELAELYGVTTVIPESVIERLEKTLIMGEQRGINEVKQRIVGLISHLRSRKTDGVANHVEQTLMLIHQWHTSSADFMTVRELQAAKEAGLIRPVVAEIVESPSIKN